MSRDAVVGLLAILLIPGVLAVCVGSWLAIVYNTFRALTGVAS